MLFPAFLLSMGLLVALHVKRKETPINLILLAAFTVVEVLWPLAPVIIQNLQLKKPIQAYTVGVLVTFFDQAVVVQVRNKLHSSHIRFLE